MEFDKILMLSKLVIENLATIESLEVTLSPGLNALTGETGAGKSIIVGGIELATGERATSDVIRTGAKVAVAEAHFTVRLSKSLLEFITIDLGIEYEQGEMLVMRREVSRKGRNRCFINGQMVNVADLKTISRNLVDLHGQHEHQSLFHTPAHRAALDAYGDHDKILENYRNAYERLTRLRKRKKELDDAAADFEKRLDYLDYQLEEISGINPEPGEVYELEREEKRLAHAEELISRASEAYKMLYENEDGAILTQLGEVTRLVEDIAGVEAEFEQPLSSLREASVLLEELSISLRDYAENTEIDPGRLNEVIGRMESIRRLIRKHGGSEESLFEALEHMKSEREQMTRDDAERKKISGEIIRAEQEVMETGKKLSEKRVAAGKKMQKEIRKIIRELAMEKAEFEIRLESMEDPTPNGMEKVEFLFSANPGMPAAPLRKIASGGELSRVMLGIKSALASRDSIPTLIFDEIDAGISGDVCRRVGQVMEKLSESHQIVCITHHAAIAARAAKHVSVRKDIRKGKTYTELVFLEKEERLQELAHMLGGRDSRAAVTLAKQLMK